MVTIFGKDSCPYTNAARDDYQARGIAVKVHQRQEERRRPGSNAALQHGRRQVPVIVEDGKVTIGFGGT